MGKNFISNLGQVEKAFLKAEDRTLNAIGIFVVSETQVRCPVGQYPEGSGRVGGNLKGSYGHKVSLPLKRVTIGSPVEYSVHVEKGTKRMSAQPHLAPAAEENMDRIEKLSQEMMNLDKPIKEIA